MTRRLQLAQDVSTPLVDLIGDYLQNCRARGLSPQTIDHDYGFVLLRIFMPWCDQHEIAALEELTQRVLDLYGVDMHDRKTPEGKPLSKWTVRTYVRSVRFFLNWAEREGENVGAKPQLPKVGKPVREVLTRTEIDAMEKAARLERDKIIVRLLADCGLRLNELRGLRVTDIKRSENRTTLHVRGKGDRDRRVPIHPGKHLSTFSTSSRGRRRQQDSAPRIETHSCDAPSTGRRTPACCAGNAWPFINRPDSGHVQPRHANDASGCGEQDRSSVQSRSRTRMTMPFSGRTFRHSRLLERRARMMLASRPTNRVGTSRPAVYESVLPLKTGRSLPNEFDVTQKREKRG
jgi:integrase